MQNIIIVYALAINLTTFFIYGLDKYKAKKGQWRISESTLISLAIIGGSIGAFSGMKVWHHKTMHNKFRYGIPVIIVIQILCLYLIYNKYYNII